MFVNSMSILEKTNRLQQMLLIANAIFSLVLNTFYTASLYTIMASNIILFEIYLNFIRNFFEFYFSSICKITYDIYTRKNGTTKNKKSAATTNKALTSVRDIQGKVCVLEDSYTFSGFQTNFPNMKHENAAPTIANLENNKCGALVNEHHTNTWLENTNCMFNVFINSFFRNNVLSYLIFFVLVWKFSIFCCTYIHIHVFVIFIS